MLYQGIIGGGSSPVEPEDLSPVLLWTNPSPTSPFEAQTVNLNLADYAGVIIEFNLSIVRTYTISRVYVKKSENLSHESAYYFGSGSGLNNNSNSRGISAVNNEGISFLNSYEGSTVNNETLIPTKIYGVKEYVVEPVGQLKNVTEVYDLSVSGNGTTKTFTATKKGSYFVFGPGYSTDRVTLTTTGEILFNVSQNWFIINLNMGDTITCRSVSSGTYTCNVYLLE